MSLIAVFAAVTLLTGIAAIILSVKSLRKHTPVGKYLGMTCLGTLIVDISYLGSVFAKDQLLFSVLSSVYFMGIDFMLMSIFAVSFLFTHRQTKGFWGMLFRFCAFYMLFDLAMLALNPITHIVIRYPPVSGQPVRFGYEMHLLYKMHLGYSYLLVGGSLGLLIWRSIEEPNEFRAQYLYPVFHVMAVVLINACFLFLSDRFSLPRLDYSILGYSLAAFSFYWSCFGYSTGGMLNKLKMSVFDKVEQGLVLFDNDQNMILHNYGASRLLKNVDLNRTLTREAFEKQCELQIEHRPDNASAILQCYTRDGERMRPLRCEYSVLTNAQGLRLGELYVFSDTSMVTDPMTGFINWENFKKISRNERFIRYPVSVLVCDINGLSFYNKEHGRAAGDHLLTELASLMRQAFTQDSMLVRGLEAQMIVLNSGLSEEQLEERYETVRSRFSQSISCAVASDEKDVYAAIAQAQQALKNKKMLNADSSHSSLISSLITALQACDNDTEEHVQRTRELGGRLAERLGLTDVEQSNVSLLCLLHDIGKISVPLEILNKPGKLTDTEWKIIQAHVEKGYQITSGIDEVREVADMVRHHHERWDGRGYPDGLEGEAIPVLSRLISIVDAYDAMTNDRAYRKALPKETAIAELKRCAGTQFDPHMVEVFLEVLSEDSLPQAAPTLQTEAEIDRLWSNPEGLTLQEHTTHPVPFSRYVLDDHSYIVDIDENFEKVTGYNRQDIRQMKMTQLDLLPESDREEYRLAVGESMKKSAYIYMQHPLQRKDGHITCVMCYGRKYYDSSVRRECSEIVITECAV